jgi:hypothetical protein
MPGWFYALLGWVGGVASTVAGSWISSKIQVYHAHRTVHLEALRDKVLIPLRASLNKHLAPFLNHNLPVVSVLPTVQHFKERATATEEPTYVSHMIVADFPFAGVFRGIEQALLEDARDRHFVELIAGLDTFYKDWTDHTRDCQQWVSEMATQIAGASALPLFLAHPAQEYVMNCELANFVHLRLFHFQTSALRRETDRERWNLIGGSQILAVATEREVERLIATIDSLLESEKGRAAAFENTRTALQARFAGLSAKLDLAIASRRLRRRCDLVSLF